MNEETLNKIIAEYKEYFKTHWEKEKYKWEAVKHFQDNWDIEADNFLEMFMRATNKTGNLLASAHHYPRGMMKGFITANQESVRKMFRNLFDQSKDLSERIEEFQLQSEELRANHDDGTWKMHFQNHNAISTYLWLRFPDEYYIYKYSIYRDMAYSLTNDYVPKKGGNASNVIKGYQFYDSVCEKISKNSDLDMLLNKALTDDCYKDPLKKTLTIDIGFFTSRFYGKNAHNDWFPSTYNPGFTSEKWAELLRDESIFNKTSLEIMKRFMDYGGTATCTQLSVKYGEKANFYNMGSTQLAKRIHQKTNCPLIGESENSKWWPILYVGRFADAEIKGVFVWKLREELVEALHRFDFSKVALHAPETGHVKPKGYWWLNANPKIWSISQIPVGGEHGYTLYNENGNKRRIFQNFLDVKSGDLIIGYESQPVKQVVALLNITKESDGKAIYFEKMEGLTTPIDLFTLKGCEELTHMEYFKNPQGSLFKLTKGEHDFIMDIIREENPVEKNPGSNPNYSKDDFLAEVYMNEAQYESLVSILQKKKNIILQGAPGVGKTFAAKRLAYSVMGEMDESRIEYIQFHQNYSYEDFIMGYKPSEEGFKLKNGIFYQFCKKAANHPEQDYFFIIDEINRGNLSKIFGELLMLIEKEYRGIDVTLAYSGASFSVPENVHLIGMMNTADRSLAMIDYALRRRFSFFEMEPGFKTDGFLNYQESLKNETFNTLVEQVIRLNLDIKNDGSLGEGFRIGHSYFCGQKECTEEWMKEVVHYEIIPMLQEYWFDDKTKLQYWYDSLSGVFDD